MFPKVPETKLNNGSQIPVLGLIIPKGELDVGKIEVAIKYGYRLFYCESDCLEFVKKIANVFQEKIYQDGLKREDFFIIYSGKTIDDVKTLQMKNLDAYLTCEKNLSNSIKEEAKAVGLSIWTINSLKNCSKKLQITLIESDNLTSNDSELLELCNSQGIKILDKITLDGIKWNKALKNEDIQNVAIRYKRSLLDVVLKYCVQSDHIVVTNFFQEDQLSAHLKIFDFYLAPEDICFIRSLKIV